LLIQNKKTPIMILSPAHNTLTVADDKPLPGGLENGVGNLLPDTPFTKCGMALERTAPEKNTAIYWYHSIIK
jgi:hypothetical protein